MVKKISFYSFLTEKVEVVLIPKLSRRITTVPGTLQSFCKGFLRELSRDYDLVAVSSETGGNGNLKTLGEEEGVRTVCVPMERQISPWKDLVSLIRMIRVMRRERPDIVHSMTPKAGLIGMVASWLAGVPVRIHTFTGLIWPTATGLRRRLLMATDRLTCACATHVIPEGEGVRQDLVRGGITKKPMKVLGYGNVRGIDLSHYDRTPEVMEAASALRRDGLFTFLFVGRVVADKGINEDRFIEMYARSMEAGLQFNKLLEAYKAETTLSDEALQTGYARIVKETFADRYTPGVYSQYLNLYMSGYRSFPSLWIPDGAIFVRLFAKTDPTDEQIEAFRAQAETDPLNSIFRRITLRRFKRTGPDI